MANNLDLIGKLEGRGRVIHVTVTITPHPELKMSLNSFDYHRDSLTTTNARGCQSVATIPTM
jgi:hypothetical protein